MTDGSYPWGLSPLTLQDFLRSCYRVFALILCPQLSWTKFLPHNIWPMLMIAQSFWWSLQQGWKSVLWNISVMQGGWNTCQAKIFNCIYSINNFTSQCIEVLGKGQQLGTILVASVMLLFGSHWKHSFIWILWMGGVPRNMHTSYVAAFNTMM